MSTATRTRRARVVLTATIAAITLCGSYAAPAASAPDRPATIAPTWTHVLRDGPWGLAVDGRGAVVVTDTDHVEALDRAGRVQWTSHVESVVAGTPGIDRSRVVVGGRHRITALARHDGRRLWWQATGGDVAGATLVDDLVVAGDTRGTMTAYDARTGATRWSVHFDGRLWSAPRVDAATHAVVATWHWSTDPAIRVFDAATGALRWEAPTGRFTAAPTVAAGSVVVATGQAEKPGVVQALDVATGAVRWSTAVPGSFEEAIEPAADPRDVVVVDHDGVVTLLDVAQGTVRWRRDVRYPLIETRVSLTGRRVVFTSFSGDLFVLDRATGRLVSDTDAKALAGYPIAAVTTSWPHAAGVLVALRYDAPYRVVLLPLR